MFIVTSSIIIHIKLFIHIRVHAHQWIAINSVVAHSFIFSDCRIFYYSYLHILRLSSLFLWSICNRLFVHMAGLYQIGVIYMKIPVTLNLFIPVYLNNTIIRIIFSLFMYVCFNIVNNNVVSLLFGCMCINKSHTKVTCDCQYIL